MIRKVHLTWFRCSILLKRTYFWPPCIFYYMDIKWIIVKWVESHSSIILNHIYFDFFLIRITVVYHKSEKSVIFLCYTMFNLCTPCLLSLFFLHPCEIRFPKMYTIMHFNKMTNSWLMAKWLLIEHTYFFILILFLVYLFIYWF